MQSPLHQQVTARMPGATRMHAARCRQPFASIHRKCSSVRVSAASSTSSAIKSHPSLPVLRQACTDKSVAPEQLEQALLALEAACPKPDAASAAQLPGTWHLMFSTATKVRAFQYIPVKEDLVMDVQHNTISLESELGPFRFLIKGTIFSWDTATGAMDFQFDKGTSILLFGNQIYEVKPKTKPKTYTWFYVDETLAAARSSAGGVSLCRRL